MNKREYDQTVKRLKNTIDNMYQEYVERVAPFKDDLSALIKNWKTTCSHPGKKIKYEVNTYDDEYGRTMESWTDYEYICERCGSAISRSKIRPYSDNIPAIQQELTNVNKK